jgi:radical SAM-linked protein
MSDVVQRWRVTFARGAAARDLDQRQELEAWEAAVQDSGLPVTSAGRRPKLTFALPLPVGFDADAERLDIGLTDRRTSVDVRSALEPRLPPGHRLIDLHDVWVGESGLPGLVVAADYRLTLDDAPLPASVAAAEELLAATALPRVRRRGERETPYDLRPLILDLRVERGQAEAPDAVAVWARLVVSPSEGTGRPGELIAALGDAVGRSLRLRAGRRERIWLADELPAQDAAGR